MGKCLVSFKEGKRNISNCGYGNTIDDDVKTYQAQQKTRAKMLGTVACEFRTRVKVILLCCIILHFLHFLRA